MPVGLSDQVMIEEMQEQEAEFLQEQKEKKLKNRCWTKMTEESVDIGSVFHESFPFSLYHAGNLGWKSDLDHNDFEFNATHTNVTGQQTRIGH